MNKPTFKQLINEAVIVYDEDDWEYKLDDMDPEATDNIKWVTVKFLSGFIQEQPKPAFGDMNALAVANQNAIIRKIIEEIEE